VSEQEQTTAVPDVALEGPKATELRAPDPELFIGLVAPIGTDLGLVVEELRSSLNHYQYLTVPLKLSALLGRLNWDEEIPADDAFPDVRAWLRRRLVDQIAKELDRVDRGRCRGDAEPLEAVARHLHPRGRAAVGSRAGVPLATPVARMVRPHPAGLVHRPSPRVRFAPQCRRSEPSAAGARLARTTADSPASPVIAFTGARKGAMRKVDAAPGSSTVGRCQRPIGEDR
jgi:hypothetical protein